MNRLHVALVALLALALLLVGVWLGRWSAAPTEARGASQVASAVERQGGSVARVEPKPIAPASVAPRVEAIRHESGARVTASGEGSTGAVKVSAPPVSVGERPAERDIPPAEPCCLLCSDSVELHVAGVRVEGSGVTGLVADAWATRASDGAELVRGPLRIDYRVVPPPRRARWAADVTWWAGDGWTAGVDRRLGPVWAGATIGAVDGRARVGIRARVEW